MSRVDKRKPERVLKQGNSVSGELSDGFGLSCPSCLAAVTLHALIRCRSHTYTPGARTLLSTRHVLGVRAELKKKNSLIEGFRRFIDLVPVLVARFEGTSLCRTLPRTSSYNFAGVFISTGDALLDELTCYTDASCTPCSSCVQRTPES